MKKNDSSTLVFSLGQGGYDIAFGDAVASQRLYCEKMGYEYFCISESGDSILGRENIWLKALAFYGALLKHKHVLYLDTDVRIQPGCPPIDQAVSEERPIGVVAGHSGRVNAGMIIARQTPQALAFFAEWVTSLGKPISQKHDVGWGENGHLIRLVEKYGLQAIDTRWNNTFLPKLDDYMRHYTGPLRDEYKFEGEAKEAWETIVNEVGVSKQLEKLDVLSSFSALKRVYERSLDESLFAPFPDCWMELRQCLRPKTRPSEKFETSNIRHVYVAEEM